MIPHSVNEAAKEKKKIVYPLRGAKGTNAHDMGNAKGCEV